METPLTSLESAKAAIGTIAYKTTITSAGHTLVADEPESVAGGNTGMNPYSLLLASLGSCTAITLRMYIERKMWVINEVTINLELFTASTGTQITRKLSFDGVVSEEQKKRLVQIANACPIHKILVGNITIDTQVS
ncbi:MAG: OsmC family protein [Mucilaginibacter sp.]